MPNMDGWQVFNRIKAIRFLHHVPVAFITAIQEAAEEKYAYEKGAADFIRKPLNRENFNKRVEVILNSSVH